MGRIKSALEIALERTEGVSSDRASIGLFEARQRGKKLANEFLAGGPAVGEAIKKAPKEEAESLRQGAFSVFVSQINLPVNTEDLQRLELVGRALAGLITDKRFPPIFQQFISAVSGYLGEAVRYEEAIRQQYAPKLRQKEEELARRFGRQVKLDPFQDPEFVAFYNQNMNALKGNYEALTKQVQAEAQRLFDA
ncbi:MAG: hypothetical protein LBB82_00040 [Treponema sp.]|jgi:hypothetical protein|nr:hypothetical protein [Treponema sp.]